jgi:hypothetical protein
VIKKLPDQNYVVLKYLVEFISLVGSSASSSYLAMYLVSLSQVVDRCDMNKTTAANLAVVFGPNLAWPNDKTMSLTTIGPINAFTEYLFANIHKVFII